MGRTKSDAIRNMIDVVIKRHSVAEESKEEIPEDGCPYFEDVDLMAQHCSRCERKDGCY